MKQLLLFFAVLITSSFVAVAQSGAIIEEKETDIRTVVEKMPEFPGGQAGLAKFLQNNIQYPKTAMKNNIQGKVYLKFVIEKDGQVGEVIVVRSVEKYLDEEAVRVIKLMPKWSPGVQDGIPVRVWFQLPINFSLK